MGFQDAVKAGFRRWLDFGGRSSRSEYWWWNLFIVIVNFLLKFIGEAIGTSNLYGVNVLAIAYILLCALPSLSLLVRRLHDHGIVAWRAFLVFLVPPLLQSLSTFAFLFSALVVWIGLMVVLCTKGTEGPNRFGEDPLGGNAAMKPE